MIGKLVRGALMGIGVLTLAAAYLLRDKSPPSKRTEPAQSQHACRPPLAQPPKRPAA